MISNAQTPFAIDILVNKMPKCKYVPGAFGQTLHEICDTHVFVEKFSPKLSIANDEQLRARVWM